MHLEYGFRRIIFDSIMNDLDQLKISISMTTIDPNSIATPESLKQKSLQSSRRSLEAQKPRKKRVQEKTKMKRKLHTLKERSLTSLDHSRNGKTSRFSKGSIYLWLTRLQEYLATAV